MERRLRLERLERRTREQQLIQLAAIESRRRTAAQTQRLSRLRDIARSTRRETEYHQRIIAQAPLLELMHKFLHDRKIYSGNVKPGRPRNHTIPEFEQFAHERPELTHDLLNANFKAHRQWQENRSAARAFDGLDEYPDLDEIQKEWPEFYFYH
jgi:hypothetical protein